jgi:EAL domain-containing protein (putative c-di-GMP-specific phosphodiesterase class I)
MTGLAVQLTASMGRATSNKLERPTTEGLTQASFLTLAEASRKAPSAVRAFSEALLSRQAARKNRQRRKTMIKKALQALTFWDKAGLTAPRICVNFWTRKLRNTRLVDRIAIHLDVGNIAPHRLVIEVLETGIADGADDDTIGNLTALADLDCGIDLDDFGTGYTSITNIRRFSVGRIKIDRSFVTGIDTDSEQRNMVAAILTMADRLGVQTLAEGVETRGEKDALNALGCHDVQGFRSRGRCL